MIQLPSTDQITGAYDTFLHIVDFVVQRTSESLAGVLIKALPLLAPVPNAISIWRIVQDAPLHYDRVQAFALAAAVEGMFFALTEVVLNMFDGYLDNAQRYRWPLVTSALAFIAYFALIMWVVAMVEHSVVARAFPVVSLIAAIVLGCARWHSRNSAQPARKTVHKTVQTEAVHSASVHNGAQPDSAPDVDPKERAHQLKSEGLTNTQIGDLLGVHRNTVGGWLRSMNGAH